MLRRWFNAPLLKRLVWHAKRVAKNLDGHFFAALFVGAVVIVLIAAASVTLVEKTVEFSSFGESTYWAVTTVMGQGNSSYVTSPGGWVVAWLLGLFGVGIIAAMTGALVGFVIDYLLKEGQGMGAAGYEEHIVICGWNGTARNLIEEFKADEYKAKVVIVADLERGPSDDAYFVRGDTTDAETLRRAGIGQAAAAIIFPNDGSDEADMRSILVALAIEDLAPEVRTVVEVNNPKHVTHFERTHVDEVVVTTRLASHLLARTAMYPGLTSVVADIVSGGDGSELYRVPLPRALVGLTFDEAAARLRSDNRATLLAISRNGSATVNPPSDFRLGADDHAVLVAETLGDLAT
jgi:voltage-gated potassium channel